MISPRKTAVQILLSIEKDKSYSSLSLASALKKENFADRRDASLVTNIVYGVLERKITIDYNLGLYLDKPLAKLHPTVLTLLRAGTYQLLFMGKIPVSAAVNETVKLTQAMKVPYAKGLVNAVLRKVSAAGVCYPPENDFIGYASVYYSCPEELVKFFEDSYGREKAVRILSAFLEKRPVYARVNTLKTNENELISRLESEGVSAKKTKLENCIVIENTGDITRLSSFAEGLFRVEDMSSQICCLVAGAKPGDTVVDCCAAPGGKSFSLAMHIENKGKIYSCDMYEHKTKLIKDGAGMLGITCLETLCRDARTLPQVIHEADVVLCDVPCSGFGVIGRKPEIKEKGLEEIKSLPEIQYSILDECCKMVKHGGSLVYSTCTLNPAENEENCKKFLASHGDFSLAGDELYTSYSEGGFINIIPSKDGGDGFFVAKFKRK